ncbi:hypothetical protein IGI04_002469, partial [Brassica rapa subsp. trilocularis]
SHHPRTLGPSQLKRTIPPLFLLLPVKSPALVGPPPSSSGSVRLCSVLRPLPAKTRRDSILPAPLFLPCHFYPMLWPRISAVFERYGRRVSFLSTLPRNMNKIWNRTPHLSLDLDLDLRIGGKRKRDLRSMTPRGHHHHSRLLKARRERRDRERERREGVAARREREKRRGEEREGEERRREERERESTARASSLREFSAGLRF